MSTPVVMWKRLLHRLKSTGRAHWAIGLLCKLHYAGQYTPAELKDALCRHLDAEEIPVGDSEHNDRSAALRILVSANPEEALSLCRAVIEQGSYLHRYYGKPPSSK